MERIYNTEFLKRFLILSLVLAIIVFSWLLIIIAIAIVVEDKGNILFKQKRIGKNKKEFYIYKFRTMKVSTPKDVPTICWIIQKAILLK